MRISSHGSYAMIDTGTYLITAETTDDRSPFSGVQPYFTGTNVMPMRIGDFEFISHGEQNNLPLEYRQILDENNITPGILKKQAQLLWGQQPALYSVDFEAGKRNVRWKMDKEVSAWLRTWDWEEYLMKGVVEYVAMEGRFSKFFQNRAPRIGGPSKIAKLEHVSCVKSRLEWPDDNDNINHIITGDFAQPWKKGLRQYPIFNLRDPFKHKVSMRYSNLPNFALENDYSRPSLFGVFNWIKLASSLPVLLMNFNKNAAAIRYHIKVPALYWADKEDKLKKNCELKGVEYKDSMLEDLKTEVFLKFGEGLIGIEKAGKMITSETIWDTEGGEYVGWEIETLDQKVKNFTSAQVEMAKRAVYEITAGAAMHPALSNLSADGNLPSGSEQLYAFKLYLSTGVDIPASIVCKDINYAIAVNFPKKDLKMGFYHDTMLTEESTTPKERVKNN